MMVLVILLVVLGIYLFARNNRHSDHGPFRSFDEDPLDILKRRFANGEITEEEYNRIKRELGV
jgi:putative membrane protein